MLIRQETYDDHIATENVVEEAFRNAEFADHTEYLLVHRLRLSSSFIRELSLVAELDNRIIGYIMFTKIKIIGEKEWESIALAPMAVISDFQKKGVGAKLIVKGLEVAISLGFKSVIVLGHEHYYPKFGFKKASGWNIKCPFDVPDEVFMAIELVPDGLNGVSGTVEYPIEFGV